MTAIEILDRFKELGVEVELIGDQVQVTPVAKVPDDLMAEAKAHKAEIVQELSPAPMELIDLPWPIGYGGLPADEVAKAEDYNARENITDPVDRRLNVLSWMRCYYRDRGDQDMAQEMKEEYHQLRHADPSIQEICGICEYSGEEDK